MQKREKRKKREEREEEKKNFEKDFETGKKRKKKAYNIASVHLGSNNVDLG